MKEDDFKRSSYCPNIERTKTKAEIIKEIQTRAAEKAK